MLRAYKYRLYPTAGQRGFLAQQFGNVRRVYNLALDMRCILYHGRGQSVSRFDTQAQLVEWKQMYPYLALSNSQSLQYAVKQVDDAFVNWWKHGAKHPLPKRRRDRQSFHNPQHCTVDWKRGTLSIPKCRDIPVVLHRPFYGKVKDITVSMEPDGRYYASVLVDTALQPVAPRAVSEDTTVGVDTGVHTFAVRSDGEMYESPRFAKASARRLKHYQRQLRLKRKGSKGREETLRHIAKIHSHVSNQRLDYLHKVTYALTHDSQVGTICIEDLDVREWMKDRRLSYGAVDVSVGKFYELLRYKCEWYGVNLVTIGRWDASSKTCSVCGAVNRSLTLKERRWTCVCCGSVHDRDYNAAINIKMFGLLALPGDTRKVTPADCPPVDDRQSPIGLRSSDSVNQEKFRGVTDAPDL